MSAEHKLILYDGVCGLCNAFVNFIIRHDHQEQFRFAALQSDLGQAIVSRHGGKPEQISTVYLVQEHGTPEESVRTRGKAALHVLHALGGWWRVPAILRFLPAFLLNLGYGLVARLRYRIWGRLEACPVPTKQTRSRFLG